MKQNKKESAKIAKELFKVSFTDSKLDSKIILKNIKIVKIGYKMLALDILKNYLAFLQRHIRNQTLTIESTEKLSSGDVKRIENYFSRKTEKALLTKLKQNPTLIGGMKITLADTEWDYSVTGKIKQLKEALSG